VIRKLREQFSALSSDASGPESIELKYVEASFMLVRRSE
jgi:hypothetical protein